MKKEDVQSKLDIIPESLEKLEILRAMDYGEFASDFRNIDLALHRFQTPIQALVDIGRYSDQNTRFELLSQTMPLFLERDRSISQKADEIFFEY